MRRLAWGLGGMAACWTAALWFTVNPSPWAGVWPGMVISGVGWWLVLAATTVLAAYTRHIWTIVLAAAVTLLLAVPTYNWAAVAPETWFRTHRSLYERAVHTADVDGSYYGSRLPLELRPLTAQGKVSRRAGGLFFPMWLGIPDDAGGYFYTPRRSPEGADMYGMLCSDPVDLGDGWWMCGMP